MFQFEARVRQQSLQQARLRPILQHRYYHELLALEGIYECLSEWICKSFQHYWLFYWWGSYVVTTCDLTTCDQNGTRGLALFKDLHYMTHTLSYV